MTVHRLLSPLALLLAFTVAPSAPAQSPDSTVAPGRIRGRVVDAATGGPIAGALVTLAGSAVTSRTDLAGRYNLEGVRPGRHTVTTRTIGYAPKAVTEVLVRSGEMTTLDITLAAAAVEVAAVEVSATVERGSTVALLEERRAAPVVVDAIGAQQIARTPDGTAAQALRRVTGLSVVSNKYVYVRGLGDRYSSAALNGAPLPSPEPDRKTVPFDLFPSNLLESVVTSKTYSPDRPGDYTGGLVDIKTREFPGSRSLRFSFGTAYNSYTSFEDGLGYPGGDLDFLGVDDGTRALPGLVPADRKVVDSELSPAQIEAIGESFSRVWAPRRTSPPVNQSFSAAYADGMDLFGLPLGFVGSLTYSNSYNTQYAIERVLVVSAQQEEPETDYAGRLTDQSVNWGALASANLLVGPTSQLTVRTLYNRAADDQARVLEGFNRDRNTNLRNHRLRFTSRSLWSNAVEGEHLLAALGGARFKWRLGYARATLDEPDRREVVYDQVPDGRYSWRELTNSGTRYFTALSDRDLSTAADLTIPLGGPGEERGNLKLGALILDKERDFFTRRFRFRGAANVGDAVFLPPDSLFSPYYIGSGLLALQEDTRRTDNYDGGQRTRAGYAMVDLPLSPALRLVGGVRLEHVRQTVQPFDLFPLGLPPVAGAVIDNTDVLPGVNVTWALSPNVNLRGAFSQTVARPEFREQAPFDFVDYAGGFLQVGNPTLRRTLIRNFDLRWEWFPQAGQLVALSGFYKSFDQPIEVVVFPSSELIATWDNNDGAEVYGAELEARVQRGPWSAAGNLTLVHSTVQTGDSLRLPGGNSVAVEPRERALQGQSPYVVNTSVTYTLPATGTSLTVLYNRFGRRIDKVGTQVLPDIYEQPRDQLDFVLDHGFATGLHLKLAGTNLLGESADYRQAGELVRRYSPGRTVSLTVSFGSRGY